MLSYSNHSTEKRVHVEFSTKPEFQIPSHLYEGLENDSNGSNKDCQNAIKDWILENCQQQLLDCITIKPVNDLSVLDRTNRRLQLLDNVTRVQRQYLVKEEVS